VVVMPERDAFSRLLLHKSAVTDHLPSAYVRALSELAAAYVPQQQPRTVPGHTGAAT
jgi:hypothetical protein